MPEEEVRIAEIKAFKTKNGNTRYVLVDDGGKEYSTFKEQIAAKLPGLEGKKVRITYHEQRREGFTNVYLDDVEPLEPAGPAGEREAEEVGWKTAMEAAPYLLDPDAAIGRSRPGTCLRGSSPSSSSSPRTSNRTETVSRF